MFAGECEGSELVFIIVNTYFFNKCIVCDMNLRGGIKLPFFCKKIRIKGDMLK